VIYVRQSTTTRQYDLVELAAQLGWPRSAIRVVDADLGVTGSVLGQRDGFESLVAEVALDQVGIILALEVFRLARDNASWYRLLDLAGACDTLVADADGITNGAPSSCAATCLPSSSGCGWPGGGDTSSTPGGSARHHCLA